MNMNHFLSFIVVCGLREINEPVCVCVLFFAPGGGGGFNSINDFHVVWMEFGSAAVLWPFSTCGRFYLYRCSVRPFFFNWTHRIDMNNTGICLNKLLGIQWRRSHVPVERTHAPFFQFQLPRWPFRLSYIQKCHEREKWYSILAIEHSISSILLASTMMTRYAILFDFGAHNDSIIPEICLQLHSVKSHLWNSSKTLLCGECATEIIFDACTLSLFALIPSKIFK